MKYEKWNFMTRDAGAEAALRRIGISPLSAIVLAGRGITQGEQADAFLSCDATRLHDPFLLRDMDVAAARLERAIQQNETIAVYGDYDVDGITSTCLLTAYLLARGASVLHYIPDRLKEGYSLNTGAITRLRLKGASLLVSVDCGITNLAEVEFARGIGLDVVITDHHECREELPCALAVVNPHRPDCTYPYKQLAGVGVVLKLILAMTPEAQRAQILTQYADFVAVGTVADVMSLTDENRAIVALGLRCLQSTRRPGLAALIQGCGIDDKPLTSATIGFSIAPRLNAAGRMGCPMVAAELLLTDSPMRAGELARTLCALNRARQRIEQEIYAECLAILEQRPALAQHAIVLAGKNWHQGVVGIVASRLTERYCVPTFMICLDENGRGKGSCRSYGDLNLFHALVQCEQLLESFGGHELAAGFNITEDNIDAFRAQMQRIAAQWSATHKATSDLLVDGVLPDTSLLTQENVTALQELEPFGNGNPQPVFAVQGVTVTAVVPVGKGKHTRLRISDGGRNFDAMLFSCTPEQTQLVPGAHADLAFYPQMNHFRGVHTVQLMVVDVRQAVSSAQQERLIYQRWQQGGRFSRSEVELLMPERQDFVAVWRYGSARATENRLSEATSRMVRDIAQSAGRPEAYARMMICLEVFQERGLLSYCVQANQLHINLIPTHSKVDLEASRIMLDLRKMLE